MTVKNQIITCSALAAITLVGLFAGIQANNFPYLKETVAQKDSVINRGSYLVSMMGCNDCHSPKIMTPEGPIPDPARLLSGHPSGEVLPGYNKTIAQSWVLFSMGGTAMVGPWGVSYAANISSDKTGIGNWTEFQFGRAMREGKFMGLDNTRGILPPMPWQSYTHMTDGDVHAIFSYLKSTKPIRNVAPEPVLNH